MYLSFRECVLKRRSLIDKLAKTFPEILVLSGDGVASLLIFRKNDFERFKIIANEKDDIVTLVKKVAKVVIAKLQSNTSKAVVSYFPST